MRTKFKRHSIRTVVALGIAASFALAACGSDSKTSSGGTTASGGTAAPAAPVGTIAVSLITKDSTNAFDRGTKLLTIRSFLSTQAVLSSNSLDGIDHCSSNNSTVCAVRSISVPMMVAGMGAYLFIRDSEEEFENAKSADRDLVFIEGATHGFTPCANCAAPQSSYNNSVKNLFDYVRDWTITRFK